jgi:hypothetical protein
MAGRWNPNDPFTIGLEWDAREAVPVPLDYGREVGTIVMPVQTVTVTGAALHMPGPPPGGADTAFVTWNLVTVYEAGQERAHGPVREVSSAVSIAATTGTLGGGAGSALAALQSASDGQFITLDGTDTVTINFALPDIQAAQPRILDVTFSMMLTPVVTGSSVRLSYQPADIDLGLIQVDVDATYHARTGEVFLGGYDYSPANTDARRRVWFQGDLVNLADGTVDFRLVNVNGSTNIFWAGMTVTYCEENRVASGGLLRSSATTYPWVPGWQTGIQLVDVVAETVGFQAVAGRRYLVTATRATDVEFDGLDRVATSPQEMYQSGRPRLLSALAPADRQITESVSLRRLSSGLAAADVETVGQAPAIVLLNSTGQAVESLSQPFVEIEAGLTSPVTQDVVSPSFDVVISHSAVTARKIGAPPPLLVQVGGSEAVVQPSESEAADVDELGYARFVSTFDVPVAFTAGVERTVSLVVGTGSNRWEIPALSTAVTGAPYPAATYGGSAQVGQGDVSLDYAVGLLTAVPAVTGLALGRGFHPLSSADPDCPDPLFHSLDYVSVCWDEIPVVSGSPDIAGAPLVTGFCAWEVERSDAVDPVWRRIAHVSDFNLRCVSDYEARINVESRYRVRLCRADGVCGDWTVSNGFVRYGPSTVDSAPVQPGTGCDGLLLTSNEAPQMTVAAPYHFPQTPLEVFQFPEAEGVVVQRLHGRDYQVAFRPLERSGSRFQRTLMVNALSMPAERLDRGFSALQDLAWATLSYVCVLDMRGGRWFAAVIVPEGTVREANQVYLASIDVIETTDRPSVIDVEAVVPEPDDPDAVLYIEDVGLSDVAVLDLDVNTPPSITVNEPVPLDDTAVLDLDQPTQPLTFAWWAESTQSAVEQKAAAGWTRNVLWNVDSSNDLDYLDLLETNGVGAICIITSTNVGHPAIVGGIIADEPDIWANGQPKQTIAQVQATAAAYEALSPGIMIFSTMGSPCAAGPLSETQAESTDAGYWSTQAGGVNSNPQADIDRFGGYSSPCDICAPQMYTVTHFLNQPTYRKFVNGVVVDTITAGEAGTRQSDFVPKGIDRAARLLPGVELWPLLCPTMVRATVGRDPTEEELNFEAQAVVDAGGTGILYFDRCPDGSLPSEALIAKPAQFALVADVIATYG